MKELVGLVAGLVMVAILYAPVAIVVVALSVWAYDRATQILWPKAGRPSGWRTTGYTALSKWRR